MSISDVVLPWYAASSTIMSRAPGVRARQSQRQLVRLARRVDEVAHLERRAASSPADAPRSARAGRSGSACSCSARASVARAASTTRGWQWPTCGTLLYASTYRRPSSSNRYCIHPRTIFDGIAIRDAEIAADRAARAPRASRLRGRSARGNRSAGTRTMRFGSGQSDVHAARCAGGATPGKSVPSSEQVGDDLQDAGAASNRRSRSPRRASRSDRRPSTRWPIARPSSDSRLRWP